ncbi:MAG: hypothetical protein AAF416_14315 [Pseudomonadota bacterium]
MIWPFRKPKKNGHIEEQPSSDVLAAERKAIEEMRAVQSQLREATIMGVLKPLPGQRNE